MGFLYPKKQAVQDYTRQTMYTAGEVYISSIIDTLTAQACYNPNIVTILQQILVGRSELVKSAFELKLEEIFKEKIEQGNIWQIPVPEEMVNKTFDKLYNFLLDKNLVALGMYRLPNANDNKYPYVSCNPAPGSAVTMHDRVFVLGNNIPRELIVDFNKEDEMPNEGKAKRKSLQMDTDGEQINTRGSRGYESDFYGTKRVFSSNLAA